MSGAVRESFLERHWMWFVIGFGLVLTLFFSLYDPRVPGVPRTTHTDPQVMVDQPRQKTRSGGD